MLRVITVFWVLLFSLPSCDDHIENGIEGRWQLQEVKSVEGVVTKVDTVFYSFKKDVFEYLKLTTPTSSFQCFGLYEYNGNILKITVDADSFESEECNSCFDWETYQRTFTITQQTPSRLVLYLEGEEYIFRKY